MAEYYEVQINNATPVEITGGRVGHFHIQSDDYNKVWFGGASLAVSYPTQAVAEITDGVLFMQHEPICDFTVNRPDELYALVAQLPGGVPYSLTLRILNTR